MVGGLLPLALVACSGGHGDDHDDDVDCTVEVVDDFVVGLRKAGEAGRLDFELRSATPAPPSRGDNEWIMQISSLTDGVVGAPVTGATIYVTPFMPKHQHGTPVDAIITPMPTAGEYKLSPVNLWMPGVWETSIEVESASGTDVAVFKVCLPS